MGIIGMDSKDVVSRKDYLKGKKKNKYKKYKVTQILLSGLIILLSVYVYKQLKLYNSVTKIANDVIEQNSLATNNKIYYVGNSYTKKEFTNIIRYNIQDKSREAIKNSENLKNIQIDLDYIYGILDGNLYKIDIETGDKSIVTKNKINGYYITDKTIYYYTRDKRNVGLYAINKENNKESKLLSDTIYQIYVDNNIYLIALATTERSIVKYDLNGKNKEILSAKQIVSNMMVGDKNIYYSSKLDVNKIYCISKLNKKNRKNTDRGVLVYPDQEKASINNSNMLEINNNLYYIDSKSKKLYEFNLKTGKSKLIVDDELVSIHKYSEKQILYMKVGDIGLYSYEISTGSSEKITSARMIECLFVDEQK